MHSGQFIQFNSTRNRSIELSAVLCCALDFSRLSVFDVRIPATSLLRLIDQYAIDVKDVRSPPAAARHRIMQPFSNSSKLFTI